MLSVKATIDFFKRMFMARASKDMNIKLYESEPMWNHIMKCFRIYLGMPEWTSDDVKTINFAETICSEIARLTMLGTSIKLDGSARAEYLQKKIDSIYFSLREWIEYGCAFGTICLKPNGDSIDLYTPDDFCMTSDKDGMVFFDRAVSEDGKKYYTRLEHHRFLEDGLYQITNKCYVGTSKDAMTEPIDIKVTPWSMLTEESYISNLDKPLYAIFRTPMANKIDINSKTGMPVISNVLTELEDLDIAYSRNAEEIEDSRRVVMLDTDKMPIDQSDVLKKGANVGEIADRGRKKLRLPKFVRSVIGNGNSEVYHEINPQLNTDERIKGINQLLSQIGFKVGFSNGYFVFDEQTGMITATQVESDDRRTIQTIKDYRDALEKMLTGIIYAIDKVASLYSLAPMGNYEVVYSFGDITYSYEEDKQTWWKYVVANKVPAWKYFMKFEGMTEEEAKEMQEEMQGNERLFGDE